MRRRPFFRHISLSRRPARASRMACMVIFIDESGTPHSKETFFSIGAVWCVPVRKSGYQNTLSYTVGRLKDQIRSKDNRPVKELHFQDGLAPHSFELVNAAHALALEDETIIKENLPWNGHPLGYRTAIFSPEGEYILAGRGPDYYNAFRARAMISVLMPLLTCKKAAQIEASIILDAEPWKRALDLCSEHLKSILGRESVA